MTETNKNLHTQPDTGKQPSSMKEGKRLIKNTGIIAIGNLSTKLVSFFLLPLYTSILSTEEYGIVDYIVSLSTLFIPFITVLMDESMFRFLIDCKTDQERSRVISMSLVIILCGGGLFLAVASPILWAIRYQYSLYVILYVLTAVLNTMTSALLRGIGRTDYYAACNFLTSLIKILLNILMIAVLRMGVEGMLLAAIFSQILGSAIYIVKVRLWKYLSPKGLSKALAKDMIHYSIPLIPNKVSWTIINLSNRLIINHSLGNSFSGLYAVSNKFPTLMDTVYGFFYQSWKESSARVVGDKGQDAFYNTIYSYLKDFMFSVVLGMTAFMPLAFHFMVDDAFADAIAYVPILLLATYFANMSGFFGGVFTAYKDTKIMGTTTIVAAVLNLVIDLALIKYVGLYAAALSTLISNVVVYFYRKIKVRKYVKLEENWKKQLLSIVAAIAVFYHFHAGGIHGFLWGCVLAVTYAVVANIPLLKMAIKIVRPRKTQRRTEE